MYEPYNVLSTLQTEKKFYVGVKQLKRAVKSEKIAYIVLAEDADEKYKKEVYEVAASNKISVRLVPKMKEMGQAVKIDIAAACVTVISV